MANLRLEKLCRGWDFPVLDEISLTVAEGEFFVLVGPSGAGKTTMLRLIAGLDTPDAGSVYFDNQEVTKIPPYKRGVAMTFESYALYPLLSVFENIASPLRARGLGKKDIRNKVHKVAELLRISELLKRRPGEISGGQKQRTALGRTLVATPQVFLLDEPLSHLDAKIRIELREQFHTLAELRRTATLYVTHDYSEALSLGDRVGVLDDRHILQIGTPTEIFEHPASIRVASQFGQPGINLAQVGLHNDGDDLVASVGDLRFTVTPKHRALLAAASDGVQLGMRPQHMQVDPAGSCSAKVNAFQSLGSYGVLSVSCGDIELKVLTEAEASMPTGELIKLSVNADACIWFDAQGMALR